MNLRGFHHMKIHHILISTGSQKWGCLRNRMCLMLSEISHFSLAIDIEIFFSLLSMLRNVKIQPFNGSYSESYEGHYVRAQLNNSGMFQYTIHGDTEYTKLVMEPNRYCLFWGEVKKLVCIHSNNEWLYISLY